MTAVELLHELHHRGITLQTDGGRLRYHPRDGIPPELVDCMREHKAELVAMLTNGWALIRRLWSCGYSLTLQEGADGKPLIVPIGQGRTDAELFRAFDAHHDAAAAIVADWPDWMRDPAALSVLPADSDGWPAGAIPWIDPKPWPPN